MVSGLESETYSWSFAASRMSIYMSLYSFISSKLHQQRHDLPFFSEILIGAACFSSKDAVLELLVACWPLRFSFLSISLSWCC